ncbi:MAG TPA: phosphatase PAP2 family protein [Desulfobacteria bacterium]|nr:phosphatase PAP2 family protein [Desulfobacteria bacterium]
MNALFNNLLSLDGVLYHLINRDLQNRAFDLIMPLITDLGSGGAVWLVILFFCAVFGKGTGRKIAFLGTVALIGSWFVSDVLLKELFARPRPFLHFPDARVLGARPDQFSFPSGHTTTSFATATAILGKSRRWGGLALFLAALIGFSRVYVGVHYPLDVAGGILVGCTVGWLSLRNEAFLDQAVVRVSKLLKIRRTAPAKSRNRDRQ